MTKPFKLKYKNSTFPFKESPLNRGSAGTFESDEKDDFWTNIGSKKNQKYNKTVNATNRANTRVEGELEQMKLNTAMAEETAKTFAANSSARKSGNENLQSDAEEYYDYEFPESA